MKIINFEKKGMIQLRNEENELYVNKKLSHPKKKGLKINSLMIKNIKEFKTIAIVLVNIEMLYITYLI